MIRPLEDDDVEYIRMHYKIENKELGRLMGLYQGLVEAEGKVVRNLCFYEWPNTIMRVYGSSDNFIDYLETENGAGA